MIEDDDTLDLVVADGMFRINMQRNTIYHNQQYIPLTSKEFLVLSYLLLMRGREVSREHLHAYLYGQARCAPSLSAVHEIVLRTRKRLKQLLGSEVITTIRRGGYVIPVAKPESLCPTMVWTPHTESHHDPSQHTPDAC